MAISTATTLSGFWLAGSLPGPVAAATVVHLADLFRRVAGAGRAETMDWAALWLGLVLAPIFQDWIGGGLDLLATGAVAGGVAYLARR